MRPLAEGLGYLASLFAALAAGVGLILTAFLLYAFISKGNDFTPDRGPLWWMLLVLITIAGVGCFAWAILGFRSL